MSDNNDETMMDGIIPVEPPEQYDEPEFSFDPEVDRFLWVEQARKSFQVSGDGLTVAVLDTGLNLQHVDFKDRIPAQVNFTNENGGDSDDATDGQGHGTNVGGIILAGGPDQGGDHTGIAPFAKIIPIKVLTNSGGGSWNMIRNGLQWVIDNRETHNITVVCMSLGDGSNEVTERSMIGPRREIQQHIQTLTKDKVAVCIAAGNDYFRHNSKQGMSFPAIVRECISVGAVYDADEGPFSYSGGAKAFSSKEGRITPFSQRLHVSTSRANATSIFAPGAPITSSGINGSRGESTQSGTSQATPVVCGLILLMQEFYHRMTGEMPEVALLARLLRFGGVTINDGDDEDDNVEHSNKNYRRVDALSALDAVRRHLQRQRLANMTT